MTDYLNLHRKTIHDAIKAARLNPTDFSLDENGNVLTIQYQNSGLYFEFRKVVSSNNQFKYKYKTIFPHKRIVTNYATQYKSVTFNACLTHFDRFLKGQVRFYIKEMNTSNPWANIPRSSYEFMKDATEAPDKPFTKEEVTDLANRLTLLAKKISVEFKLQQGETRKLQAHIEKLIEASSKQSKKDWKMFAFGVLASIITNLSFDIEQGKRLYNLFIDALTKSIPLLKGL